MDDALNSKIHYLYSFAFLYAPVIIALAFIIKRRLSAVLYPSLATLDSIPSSLRLILRGPVLWTLFIIGLGSLSVALSRPQRQTVIQSKTQARNLMLVLDLSRSMTAVDFSSERGIISRMGGVRQVVAEFVKSRAEDRLGLVIFGSTAFLQCPLTLDHSLLEALLARLEPGIAGDATAMGDGLGVALKRMRNVDPETSTLILLTDGVNNAGQIPPLKAASLAKEMGLKVHTIGIGSVESNAGGFSQIIGPAMEFDEKTLKEIAQMTGGKYFNAESLEGLKEVYAEIDRLERSDSERPENKKIDELFPWYAMLALASLCTYWLLKNSVFLKVPNG